MPGCELNYEAYCIGNLWILFWCKNNIAMHLCFLVVQYCVSVHNDFGQFQFNQFSLRCLQLSTCEFPIHLKAYWLLLWVNSIGRFNALAIYQSPLFLKTCNSFRLFFNLLYRMFSHVFRQNFRQSSISRFSFLLLFTNTCDICLSCISFGTKTLLECRPKYCLLLSFGMSRSGVHLIQHSTRDNDRDALL